MFEKACEQSYNKQRESKVRLAGGPIVGMAEEYAK